MKFLIGLVIPFIVLGFLASMTPEWKAQQAASKQQRADATARNHACFREQEEKAEKYVASRDPYSSDFCRARAASFYAANLQNKACVTIGAHPCSDVRAMFDYCPPKDWPEDLSDPAVLSFCKVK